MSAEIRIFGVRHHGPGSARSLRRALEAMEPDVVLLEGPPDADEILPFAAHADMKPPVAILVYDPASPQRAVFYPFAMFSPEWQAIQYAIRHNVPIRFMDLPQCHRMAPAGEKEPPSAERPDAAALDEERTSAGSPVETPPPADSPAEAHESEDTGASEPSAEEALFRADPLAALAAAAGFEDSERWWDHLVESRRQGHVAVFDAIAEAMAALREPAATLEEAASTADAAPSKKTRRARTTSSAPSASLPRLLISDAQEACREAWMRKTIRAAVKEGRQRIAVVCGAWHAPALRDVDAKGRAAEDAALLKGLARCKTAAAWVPWSYDRLTFHSGYGAGVRSPEWYHLVWSDIDHVTVEWLTRAARLMRKKDLDVSSGHIIEATRLAEALAAMRNRPHPGLEELDEAALTVMCFGEDGPMGLVRRRLVVGERLGHIPDDAPLIPLQADLQRQQKTLRLPARTVETDYDLDLRKPLDLERSRFLHRLRLLDIRWGEPTEATGKVKGTFHEFWRLQWDPEFIVELVEAGRWGNTIADAAGARTADRAGGAANLPELTTLLDDAILADLPEAVAALLAAIQAQAAVAADVPALMEALPPLANVSRYGSVRQTDVTMVLGIVRGLVERICVGLPNACASLDDEAAQEMLGRVGRTHGAIKLLDIPELVADWQAALAALADQQGLHGLIAGRSCRLLLDDRRVEPAEAARRLSYSLSTGADPLQGAAWVEGFLAGSGAVLIHDPELWAIVDSWVSGLPEGQFDEVLPLLRRTFATFSPPERRQMGQRVQRTGPGVGNGASAAPAPADFDLHRAEAVLPVLAQILGISLDISNEPKE